MKRGGAGRGGAGMRKFSNPSRLYLIFFYFLFYYILFFIIIILKLIYFIKNKNIMNFYKLFIKKHSNYYYYIKVQNKIIKNCF